MEIFDSAADFLDRSAPFLAEREIVLSGLVGKARRLAEREETADTLCACFGGEGAVTGVALRGSATATLQISDLDDASLVALIDHCSTDAAPVAEIYGPRSSVDRFRDLWGARHGDRGTLAMAYGLFTADRIEVPEDDGGSIVVAGPEHRDRVRAWLEAFQREALPKEPVDREAIARMVDHRVARRDVGLWTDRDGRPRSMVARNRETDHAACISWVYTPPEDRGQGLGGRVTAHWSARLLGAGARAVFLYTDLANPVSNRLYPRLGFRRIGTDARVRFGGEAGTSCCFEGEDPAG